MSRFLKDFEAYIREGGYHVLAAAEICSGQESVIRLEPANRCQDVYSVAKAFAVTAVGLLFDRGLISPEEKVCDILGELCPEGMDTGWKKTTVDMALRHRLGLPMGFLDIDVTLEQLWKRSSSIYVDISSTGGTRRQGKLYRWRILSDLQTGGNSGRQAPGPLAVGACVCTAEFC